MPPLSHTHPNTQQYDNDNATGGTRPRRGGGRKARGGGGGAAGDGGGQGDLVVVEHLCFVLIIIPHTPPQPINRSS